MTMQTYERSIDNPLRIICQSYHSMFQRATKAIVIICHVQKPPKIYAERSLSGVQRQEGHPGDRDDNLWATIDTYRPATTQSDWEKSCFLDGSFHGYYLWPQTIRYAVNKRARYTDDDLPAPVAVLYHRFRHEDFLNRALQMMLLSDEKELGKTRLAMFKVRRRDGRSRECCSRLGSLPQLRRGTARWFSQAAVCSHPGEVRRERKRQPSPRRGDRRWPRSRLEALVVRDGQEPFSLSLFLSLR